MKNDDYLWDGSGPADAEVQRLERLLAPLRSHPAPFQLPASAPRRRVPLFVPILAAAAIVAIAVLVWRTRAPRAGWDVASLAGHPRISGSAMSGTGRLAVGETLTTDADSQARIDVSAAGEVHVSADTRVRLLEAGKDRYRLALDRGTLNAFITAPPGQFVVDTPAATATDLGCAYTLHVDDDGTGFLSVMSGWVAFEFNGRESFVPAGASCRTDKRAGPGTPRFDDADHEFQVAVERFDFSASEADRTAALMVVLNHARPRDALTLWHLLVRVRPAERGAVFDALAARVEPPAGVTRERVLALDRGALDQWWNAFGLRDATFWRKWKRPLP
jgi:hypothetical protein